MASAMMEGAIKEYYGKNNIPDSVAQLIGPELDALEGLTNADAVNRVHDNPKKYPHLHEKLLWHDPSAGILYRNHQMAYLRRSYEVKITYLSGESVRSKGSYLVPVTMVDKKDNRITGGSVSRPVRVSVLLEKVREDEDLIGFLLDQAKNEVRKFSRAYKVYRTAFCSQDPRFENLFEALDAFEEPEKPDGVDESEAQ